MAEELPVVGWKRERERKRRKEGISSADLRAPGGTNEESSYLRHCDYWTSFG